MLKTIKLQSHEYFILDEVLPLPYFLIGGRGTGKSFTVKNYVKNMILKSNFEKKYIYVRISKNELSTHDSWLEESGITQELPFDADNVKIKRGKPFANATSLVYTLPSGEEQKHIGYVASLETSALIKSGVYNDVECIIFEEFIRRGMNQNKIDEYCFNFSELIETVMRNRKIPIFFIANTLNAYNPLMQLFNESIVYKIFSEQRRENIKDSMFAKYLQGELYRTGNYNINDFAYLTTIKMNNGQPLSFYCDKYYFRDILITSKNQTLDGRKDLLYQLSRNFLYNFSTMNFIFDNDKTEVYFYTNIENIKLKIRNKIQKLIT